MVSDWRHTRLGQEVDLLTGFPFRSDEYTENENDIPLLRGDNIIQGTLRWENVKRWPQSKTNDLKAYFLERDDVIVAMDRPWIEAGLKYAAISDQDLPCLLVQRVARLRTKDTLDQRFLKYVIGSMDFTNYVLGVQTGTAVPHISGNQIKDFHFLCPSLTEQREIAYILGSLDDKIELNRQTNITLEETARTLFKSWFVDFDPVRAKAEGRQPDRMDAATAALFPNEFELSALGEIPIGWHIRPIGDVLSVMGGSTPSTKEPAYWDGGTINWATPKDLSSLNSPVLLGTERQITSLGLQQISSGLLPPGTVLLSSRAPIGYLVISEIPVAINQGFIAMLCDGPISNFYTLFWTLANMDVIKAHASGTTFQEISKSNFRPIPALIPSSDILLAFDRAIAPLYQRLVSNLREIKALSDLRDTLLPKLISGEVRL